MCQQTNLNQIHIPHGLKTGLGVCVKGVNACAPTHVNHGLKYLRGEGVFAPDVHILLSIMVMMVGVRVGW